MNIYTLAYKLNIEERNNGILHFTNKKLAIETARYYRDRLGCAFTCIRLDKPSACGICDIQGFIDF